MRSALWPICLQDEGNLPRNGLAAGWLLADMALNIWALAIVKALGLGYPAFQLVFLRAGVGFLLMLPWIWRYRSAFVGLTDLRLHALRVGFSAIALTASFFAISRVPLALFTAVSFTRPILTMIAAAWLLREVITRDRWIAAVVGLVGVVIAVDPSSLTGGWGLAAQGLVVVAATGAVIATRKLVAAPTVVMMTFYTAGLAIITAPFAVVGWQPIPISQWPLLAAIGVFAQAAQFCFLRAHRFGQAGFLAVLSYASLVFSTTVGYLVFDELPQPGFWVGAILILAATNWIVLRRRPI
ncbi:DMT family transporter [Octadecabacter antarcticus]|uniref:DMT family transporter n=1 Tax=Octadecabacter antarcticus TaxID=1217908 RepID=UPI001C2F8403|nr:DMT family transporter [Octadecabacter antarcticus]